jgi:hypothetical protein
MKQTMHATEISRGLSDAVTKLQKGEITIREANAIAARCGKQIKDWRKQLADARRTGQVAKIDALEPQQSGRSPHGIRR